MTHENNLDKQKELTKLMEGLKPENQNFAIVILRSMLFAQEEGQKQLATTPPLQHTG